MIRYNECHYRFVMTESSSNFLSRILLRSVQVKESKTTVVIFEKIKELQGTMFKDFPSDAGYRNLQIMKAHLHYNSEILNNSKQMVLRSLSKL